MTLSSIRLRISTWQFSALTYRGRDGLLGKVRAHEVVRNPLVLDGAKNLALVLDREAGRRVDKCERIALWHRASGEHCLELLDCGGDRLVGLGCQFSLLPLDTRTRQQRACEAVPEMSKVRVADRNCCQSGVSNVNLGSAPTDANRNGCRYVHQALNELLAARGGELAGIIPLPAGDGTQPAEAVVIGVEAGRVDLEREERDGAYANADERELGTRRGRQRQRVLDRRGWVDCC